MIEISDENFDEVVLASDKVVVVDFFANWCQPCKAITPILEELEYEYNGKVSFTKINVDIEQQNVAKFSVRGIPTILIFKNGNLITKATGTGVRTKSDLKTKIDVLLT